MTDTVIEKRKYVVLLIETAYSSMYRYFTAAVIKHCWYLPCSYVCLRLEEDADD
jgi:hypothetical protein